MEKLGQYINFAWTSDKPLASLAITVTCFKSFVLLQLSVYRVKIKVVRQMASVVLVLILVINVRPAFATARTFPRPILGLGALICFFYLKLRILPKYNSSFSFLLLCMLPRFMFKNVATYEIDQSIFCLPIELMFPLRSLYLT